MTKLILPALAVFLLSGCGDDDESTQQDVTAPQHTLVLNRHQNIYTAPSSFSISSTEQNYQCTKATLYNANTVVDLAITEGRFNASTETITCTFDNLPSRVADASYLVMEFSEIDALSNPIEHHTSYFQSLPDIRNDFEDLDVNANPVREISTEDTFTFLSTTNSSDFLPAVLDESGLGRAMAQIILDHFDIVKTEQEAIDLSVDIETANTIVLSEELTVDVTSDTITDIDASLAPDSPINFSGATPFLAKLNVENHSDWFAVVKYDSTHITVVHPFNGYIRIPMDTVKDPTQGILINNELPVWILSEPEPEEEPEP